MGFSFEIYRRVATARMVAFNVSSNYKRLSRSLDQVGKKQLPFAFAKTPNETMKAVEKYTVARIYPRAFDVRNRAFFTASMFIGSDVRRATQTRLRVSARDRFDRGNLELHATGGTKRARSVRKERGEPGAYAKRYVLEPLSIVRKVTLIGMAHAMRSTSGMGVVVARSGCSTFCNPERGYGSASGSMRTRNGSRGWYRPSYSGETLVRRSRRLGVDQCFRKEQSAFSAV